MFKCFPFLRIKSKAFTKSSIKINKLASIISRFFNKKVILRKNRLAKGSVKDRCPNILKIKKLGFKKKFDLNLGLSKTIEWYV